MTKKERIAALEAELAAMKAEMAELQRRLIAVEGRSYITLPEPTTPPNQWLLPVGPQCGRMTLCEDDHTQHTQHRRLA